MWSITNGHGIRSRSVGVRRKVLGVEVQHDVPSERLDPIDDPPELVELGGTTEMFDEVEPRAPHPDVVQRRDVGIGERLIDHRHARISAGAALECVDHRRVVGAMARRLDEHRSVQREAFLQPRELFDARVRRGVRAIGREREAVGRAEDVAVRVGGAIRR